MREYWLVKILVHTPKSHIFMRKNEGRSVFLVNNFFFFFDKIKLAQGVKYTEVIGK